MKSTPVLRLISKLALEDVCKRLPTIAERHGFGVFAAHNLREKMASKGVRIGGECRVFEVCNPQQAQAVLTADMDFAGVLPCRISVYDSAEGTVLVCVDPGALFALFGKPAKQIPEAEQAIRSALLAIMDEAGECSSIAVGGEGKVSSQANFKRIA